jgi:hypothetical protein
MTAMPPRKDGSDAFGEIFSQGILWGLAAIGFGVLVIILGILRSGPDWITAIFGK